MNRSILAITVAIILVGGGVGGAAYYLYQKNNNSDSEINWDDSHFDLSGAESLLIADGSQFDEESSSKTTSVSVSDGKALIPYEKSNSKTNALYKMDKDGKYSKVQVYRNGGSTSDKDKSPRNIDFIPLKLEISDDRKFVLITYAFYSDGDYFQDFIMVTIPDGKIYKLPYDPFANYNQGIIKGDLSEFNGGINAKIGTECLFSGAYSIVSSLDSGVLLYNYMDNMMKFIHAYVENDKLVLKELLTSELMGERFHSASVYDGGLFTTITEGSYQKYLIFLNGGFKKWDKSLIEYGDKLCTAITYYDEDTKLFAKSYTQIKSYDPNTDKYITETVNLSKEESYKVATENYYRSLLCKNTVSEGTVVYVLETYDSLYKFKLNTDCTVTDLGRTTLPFGVLSQSGNNYILTTGDYLHGYSSSPSTFYVIENGIYDILTSYANKPTTFLENNTLYKMEGETLRSYNVVTDETEDYTIPSVAKINSMEIVSGKIIISGVSTSGQKVEGRLDLSTGTIDTKYINVLREVRLTAINGSNQV